MGCSRSWYHTFKNLCIWSTVSSTLLLIDRIINHELEYKVPTPLSFVVLVMRDLVCATDQLHVFPHKRGVMSMK
jgi:hypothetical protein